MSRQANKGPAGKLALPITGQIRRLAGAMLFVLLGAGCGEDTPVGAPQIQSFTAEPLIVDQGQTASLSWSVQAPGYVLASGSERDLSGTGPVRTAAPRLQRGWSARLHLRDAAGEATSARSNPLLYERSALSQPPVAGVRVYADGREVARSDASGTVELVLGAPPNRLEVVAPGWTVLDSENFRGGTLAGSAREAVVWLRRD